MKDFQMNKFRMCSNIFNLGIIFVLLALVSSIANASKYSAVVVDGNTREILFADGATMRRHPAGLVKLMTLYVAIQAIEEGEVGLDDKVIISNHAASEAPVKWAYDWSEYKVEIPRATAVHGSNDAATAIAEHIEGTEAAFARRMNRTAEVLGMTLSTFRNAHGLTESGQLTTALDMANFF